MDVSGQLHAQADLPPGKEPPVPTGEGTECGVQNRSGHCGKESSTHRSCSTTNHTDSRCNVFYSASGNGYKTRCLIRTKQRRLWVSEKKGLKIF